VIAIVVSLIVLAIGSYFLNPMLNHGGSATGSVCTEEDHHSSSSSSSSSSFFNNSTSLNGNVRENNISNLLPHPDYDEGLSLGLFGNYESLSYNVTAVAQTDSFGYGPAYLVDGYTSSGHWYQVGIAYNWPLLSGSGYLSGFHFFFQVWQTNGTMSIFPNNGGGGLVALSSIVDTGDLVQLSLAFQDGNVSMRAFDWNTSARASVSYSAFGDSQFVGGPPNSHPTNIQTEWYHVDPYFCSEKRVTFSNFDHPFSSGWLCIAEEIYTANIAGTQARNYTSPPPNGSTNYTPSNGQVFSGCPNYPINYSSNPERTFSYSLGGTIMYSNASEFVTM
jgi:hypothetical protein